MKDYKLKQRNLRASHMNRVGYRWPKLRFCNRHRTTRRYRFVTTEAALLERRVHTAVLLLSVRNTHETLPKCIFQPSASWIEGVSAIGNVFLFPAPKTISFEASQGSLETAALDQKFDILVLVPVYASPERDGGNWQAKKHSWAEWRIPIHKQKVC
jgi:hypothetical protein